MSTLRQGLEARTEQRMAILPRMLQSIEILQLATADLLAMIDNELEQNETLELIRDAEPVATRPKGAESDTRRELLESAPAREKDLWTHVRDEVALLDLSDRLERDVLALASCLDDRGYLGDEYDQLATEVGEVVAREALDVLRSIEPRGLGARGPVEAMLLQVDADDPDRPLIEAVLVDHIDDVGRNRLPEVARAVGLEIDEFELLLDKIAALTPRPAAGFSTDFAPGIRPDVIVQVVDGQCEVVVDDLALPILGVNEDYSQMAADVDAPRELRRYLGAKLRSARDLIEAVEGRKRTLCVVTAAILAAQPGFLQQGRAAIRPLRMDEIATRVEFHPSTVSRAIAGKYLGYPAGVIGLREFFDGGGRPAAAGAAGARGRTAVRELIRELIANEDPRAPLSDDAICARLRARGIQVARRTVAKYRTELRIPARARRRRHGGGGDA